MPPRLGPPHVSLTCVFYSEDCIYPNLSDMAGFLARHHGDHSREFQRPVDEALGGAREENRDDIVSLRSVEAMDHDLPANKHQTPRRFLSGSGDGRDFSWWLRWSAVMVGVLANLLSSTYYTIMSYLEGEGMWTIRLSLVTIERYIFAGGAIAIVTALVLDFAALSQGQDVDATVFFLSAEVGVFLSTVVIPAILTHKLRVLVSRRGPGRAGPHATTLSLGNCSATRPGRGSWPPPSGWGPNTPQS